jgi:hypothetical protein
MKSAPRRSPLKVLVVDVGGTQVKCLASGQQPWRRFASGPNLKRQPPRTRRGDNTDAFRGGLRLWGALDAGRHRDPVLRVVQT